MRSFEKIDTPSSKSLGKKIEKIISQLCFDCFGIFLINYIYIKKTMMRIIRKSQTWVTRVLKAVPFETHKYDGSRPRFALSQYDFLRQSSSSSSSSSSLFEYWLRSLNWIHQFLKPNKQISCSADFPRWNPRLLLHSLFQISTPALALSSHSLFLVLFLIWLDFRLFFLLCALDLYNFFLKRKKKIKLIGWFLLSL